MRQVSTEADHLSYRKGRIQKLLLGMKGAGAEPQWGTRVQGQSLWQRARGKTAPKTEYFYTRQSISPAVLHVNILNMRKKHPTVSSVASLGRPG